MDWRPFHANTLIRRSLGYKLLQFNRFDYLSFCVWRNVGVSYRCVFAKGRMTLVWSSSLDSWQELKCELQLEAESIFASSGEVVIVAPDSESDSVMTLEYRGSSLKITFYPERSAVRWDSPEEYGFEKIPEDTTSLARTLMQRLRR